MKTFKEYILEIFDNPYDYNIHKFYRPNTFAYFVTKGTLPKENYFLLKFMVNRLELVMCPY